MKKLIDNTEVPDRCYYYMLHWKDTNMESFKLRTNKESVGALSNSEFWNIFGQATKMDLINNINN